MHHYQIGDDLKAKIRAHYDFVSPLYRDLWGLHIHHGYWINGKETKEQAQEQLIELLAHRAGLKGADRVLDIGCGVGGPAVFLAARFGVRITGITISPVQAIMSNRLAASLGLPGCDFVVMDAEYLAIRNAFDVVWAVESLSHMKNKQRVLSDTIALLKNGGRYAIADWFKCEDLTTAEERAYIKPIVESMLVPELNETKEYISLIQNGGCHIVATEYLTDHVSNTWAISEKLTRKPGLWRAARSRGTDFVRFLRGIRAMRRAFKNGAFRYALIIAEKSAAP